MKRKTTKVVGVILLSIIALLLIIQIVPYGRDHQNPAVIQELSWDSPETRQLAARACFDCHSNETVWPWYTSVAPMSWLAQHDVDEGREELNFSDISRFNDDAEEAAEVVLEGEMPPVQYLLLHLEARLTENEAGQLAYGLKLSISGFSNSDED